MYSGAEALGGGPSAPPIFLMILLGCNAHTGILFYQSQCEKTYTHP
jgi:hypothetical protein